MCKIKYEAKDGKQFDTEEECKYHESKPRVYIIYEEVPIKKVKVALTVMLTKEETEAYVKECNATKHGDYLLYSFEETIVKGSIEKLIGRKLTQEDEPVELKEE